jgi:hypothetical protein
MVSAKRLLVSKKVRPAVSAKARKRVFFVCLNSHHDVRDWVWSYTNNEEGAKTLTEALATVKTQIKKANALTDATPAQERKKSQSLSRCYDILASILAHAE